MNAQMQKRARGISRVGRRLFPNLRTTGLPPAWFQLLGDPIIALDGLLASVTSVATPDSEENSIGPMSDSPPPHTFRQPQQSLAPSQIAYDPAIALTQKQAPGISRVGSRLFPDLGGTGLPPAWSQVPGDPITALDRRLASVTSVPIPDSEESSTGTISDSPRPHTFPQPQQSPVSSQIARVGRRLFPDLGETGLPPAWSQVRSDPITTLDRRLASVTSVAKPDSEENSTGTLSDSPPPHTFRQPQQSFVTSVAKPDSEENSTGTMSDSLPPHTFRQPQQSQVSSRIAHHPAMAVIQRQAPGISGVGSRLFPDLGGTGLPPAWSQLLDDPITALERRLAFVTSVPTPDSEGNSTGAMSDSPPPHTFGQPEQSLAWSQIAYDPAIAVTQRQAPGISGVGSRLFPDWSQVRSDPITALDGRLASVTSVAKPDSEGNSTGTMSDSPPPHTFRQPQQSLASSQIANDPVSALMQRQAPGISRVGSRLFPDLGGTGLPAAWPQVLGDPITALDGRLASVTALTRASETPTENTRGKTAAPPNFFAFGTDADTFPPSAGHGQSASPTALQPADISPGFRSSGVSIVGRPKPNFVAAGRSSSLPKDRSGRTKLVPFSRLAEMLHPGGPADESRTDLHSLEPTEAEQTAPAGSHPPSQAVTVEAVLEQLEQRLQFEFLRMYGSSGE